MDQLQNLLAKFDLDEKEIAVYLLLLKKKSLSATAISKATSIPKTTVYRALEKLREHKLVTEIIDEYRKLYEAESPENLKYKVKEYEEKTKILADSFPLILESLGEITNSDVSKSKIKYYSGLEGLKQVTWNSSKAKGMLRIFEIQNMSKFLNYDFCELARQEFVNNKVTTHELTNEAKFPGWTNVTELVKNYWEIRYIDPKKLKMEFEMLVYNDVFVMYNHEGDKEIFCAEIYNERLARMQKQVFDFIWLKGKKVRILDEHGAGEVIKQI